ncbi:MAG: hypothetical protein Q9224_006916 [Gallowayella concinna]
MASSAAGPPETRREERDIIVNTNTNVNNSGQGPPATHAETREKEAKMLALVSRTVATSKVAALREAKIGAVKVLPSGDWRISTAIPKWTELLRFHSNQWVNTVGPQASIAVPTYGVIVDGIRVETANLENQKGVIEELQRQNCGVLTPERNIASLRWLTKPKRNFCSLVIEFTEAAACNAVVGAQELFWNNELRRTRRFIPGCNLNQCFKCHQYGHRSTQCKNPACCGYCSEKEHVTAACPSQEHGKKSKCPLCRMEHPAWSRDCKVRKEQKDKARVRIEGAPRFWAEPAKSVSISPGPSVQDNGGPSQNVGNTAGVKRPLEPVHGGKSNARATKSIGKKIKQKKLSLTQAMNVLHEKENETVGEDRDEAVEEGSDLSRSSEGSGDLFKRITRRQTRTVPFEIHEEI